MRYILLIPILLFSSCSAQWHLQKALEKDSTIIDIKADTTINIDTSIIDTTVVYQDTFELNIVSDTIEIKENTDTTINKLYHSKDSIAHALVNYNSGILKASVWATTDTTLIHRDSLKLSIKKIDSLQTIVIEKKAEIKELRTFREKVRDVGIIVVWVIGALIFLLIFFKIIKLF
jgi:hypothetical protein